MESATELRANQGVNEDPSTWNGSPSRDDPRSFWSIEDGRKSEIMVGLKAINGLNEKTLWERRELLRSQPNVCFVEPEQFCALAVSCRKISRADESAAGLKGLHSELDDRFYYVEEERLDRYRDGLSVPDVSLELV